MNRDEILDTLRWIISDEGREALGLIIREIFKILKHARFRKVSGEIIVGSSDPYTEGRILSFLSVLYPIYGREVSVTPFFDRDELSGELRIKGRLRLIHVLLSGIKLLRNKEIRGLVLGGRKHGTDK